MSGLRSNGGPANSLLICNRVDYYLTTDGTQSGSADANVNGSVTPQKFYRTASRDLWVWRLLITIGDAGTSMAVEKYGGITTLTNGCKLEVIASDGSTVLRDLLDNRPVKTNYGWGERCYDVNLLSFGSGEDVILCRWTFANAGAPLYLQAGQRLQLTVQDDLTGLTRHKFVLQGQMP